jgi:hypothetical protein
VNVTISDFTGIEAKVSPSGGDLEGAFAGVFFKF